jgi:6-phosphogluconolactonase/glucosamine-6-phosphate isomerase/deaminase
MPVLTAAREVVVLVSGNHKAQALASVLHGEADVPARELDAEAGDIVWIVDRDAAGALAPDPASAAL